MKLRDIFIGFVAPLAALAATIAWRISWPYDIHPVEPVWCAWVASLCLTSAYLAVRADRFWRSVRRSRTSRSRP